MCLIKNLGKIKLNIYFNCDPNENNIEFGDTH